MKLRSEQIFKNEGEKMLSLVKLESLVWKYHQNPFSSNPGGPVGEPYDGREGARLYVRDGGRSRQTDQGD